MKDHATNISYWFENSGDELCAVMRNRIGDVLCVDIRLLRDIVRAADREAACVAAGIET